MIAAGKYDEAVDHIRKALEVYPQSSGLLEQLVQAHNANQTGEKVLPVLDSLKALYPANLELQSLLHQTYSKEGMAEEAHRMLEEIHRLKPAAVQPYQDLDSLHNNVSYDSLFGSTDVTALWDEDPDDSLLGGQNYWFLLDSRKTLVFESGMEVSDVQWAQVLLDREAVERLQETYLGFDADSWPNKLVSATRLRKGQPPLAGQVEGNYVHFQDLQPGDAVQLHYRLWTSRGGDLWSEFWDSYRTHTQAYQRRWEFTVLTERDDLKYEYLEPAPDPVVSTHYGYKQITWSGERAPAIRLDQALAPPDDDLAGEVKVSTIPDWTMIRDWYFAISQAILDDNPRTLALADSLAADLESDKDKLTALYDYVVQSIPYQVFDFDYSSAVPHKPDQVLVNRWGDCKDKGHLLIAMLRQVGIDAWPVLVMTTSNGTRLPLPYFGFNHLITGCVIAGDTIYVDATDALSPAMNSLSSGLWDQPMIPVVKNGPARLQRLPVADVSDSHWSITLNLTPKDDRSCEFHYDRVYHNLKAGYRRYNLLGTSESKLKEEVEADYSRSWGIRMRIDSLTHSPFEATTPTYDEHWYGTIAISTQQAGNILIVNLPDWSTISPGTVAQLLTDVAPETPVDLRGFTGHFEKVLVFNAPPEYGEPQLSEPVEISDSLFSFTSVGAWNPETRVVRRTFDMRVSAGYCSRKEFEEFAGKVIDAFSTPLVFNRD
jgi:hypothetical protein